MTRDRSPFRYLPWLARSVAEGPLALFVAVIIGLSLVLWRVGQVARRPMTNAAELQDGTWRVVLTVAVLIAVGGVMGTDVQRGYYRTYFSKPMAPAWFYLQRFLLGVAAVIVAPLLYGVGVRLALHTPDFGLHGTLFAAIAMGTLLIGGATLLLSTVTSRDWLVVFLLVFVQHRIGDVVQFTSRSGVTLPRWIVWPWRLLPPFHLVDPSVALHGSELAHVLLYGVGMIVAALAIMAYRPLGSGGRA
jgi:hypothetical protein